jgi:hypothetical protein
MTQNDLLGHAAEGLPKIGQVRNWIAQLLEQRGIELVALERAERLGVEADRPIEFAQAIAHPGDDVDEQGGRRARDFDQRGSPETQSLDHRASACGRATRQFCERPQFANQRGRTQDRNGDRAASAVGADRHLSFQEQHGEIAGFALHHKDGVGLERLEFGRFDQKCEMVVGQVTERARRLNGGAQFQCIFHFMMSCSAPPTRAGAAVGVEF